MTFTGSADAPEFATLTHVKVRLAQGDIGGARRILRSILEDNPDDAAARRFLDSLAGRSGGDACEVLEDAPPPVVAADARALRERFQAILGSTPREPAPRRITRRLEQLLENVDKSRRANRAR